jgi:hypothetical protein
MSDFPSKHFQGKRYEFTHLRPLQMTLVCGEANAQKIHIHTSFSIHCFTEAFDTAKHLDHHRYTFQQELRAFDPVRYECSLSLPDIIRGLARSKIYRASNSNYTYVAQIKLAESPQPYSIFFQLKLTSVQLKVKQNQLVI